MLNGIIRKISTAAFARQTMRTEMRQAEYRKGKILCYFGIEVKSLRKSTKISIYDFRPEFCR
jgi:hypothetical protein